MKKDVLVKINKWYYKNTLKNVKVLAKRRREKRKEKKINNEMEENV